MCSQLRCYPKIRQPMLADISQFAAEMQKSSEVLPTMPKVDTVLDTTLGSSEHEDIEQPVLEHVKADDICGETDEEKDKEFVKKPGEFTTEVFKIEIRNLPRYSGYKVR